MRVLKIAALTGMMASGSAFALDTVTITVNMGNEERREELEKNMKNASLSQTALDEEITNSLDLLGSAQADYARMVSILYNAGYYGPSVSIKLDGVEAADVDPFEPPKSINTIAIDVKPGPRFQFGEAKVAPRAPNATADPIVSGFASGEVAQASLVGSAANAGVSEWRDEGHAKADVEGQTIEADHSNNKLNVDVELSPGPKLRFGNLTITGNSEVSEKRIRQILGYPEGDVFSPTEIRDAVNRLRRAGVWSVVTLTEAETPNADGSLDYTLAVVDEKKRRFGFSGEYSTLDGVTVGAFWLHRNLFGGGERLRIDGEIKNIGGTETGLGDKGGEDYKLSARLTRPGTFGADNDAFAYARIESVDDPEYSEDSIQFGVGVSRYFSDKLYGEAAGGLRYSQVNDAFGEREFYHIVLPSRLEWDNRDNPGDATKGTFVDAQFQPYVGLSDSETGAVLDLDNRAYKGFGENSRVVLAGRLQLGSVVGSSLSGTPPDFLFFSGGGDTVRGQRYQSLGVTLPNGDVSGGKSFLGLSGEIRTKITDTIGAVVFYDAGFVGPDSFVNDQGEWQSGTGFGVRYATPIGPLRVDLATPVEGQRDAFSSVELYIGVGQAF